nr:glycerol-3-phosphate dehydrogenase C-terminal domain-containing protein [Nocardiopsis sp. CNR-923]
MAKDAVDAVAHGLGGGIPDSVTDRLPLVGADGYAALRNQRQALARGSGLHVSRVSHLLRRYGSSVHDLLTLIRERPDLGRPLEAAEDYLRAEVVYAALAEGARHLEDVLSRRTRISFETWDRGIAVAEEAAELLAVPLEWDEEQVKREVEFYRKGIEAERAAQEQDTDQEADAIQHGAPEIVPEAGIGRPGGD